MLSERAYPSFKFIVELLLFSTKRRCDYRMEMGDLGVKVYREADILGHRNAVAHHHNYIFLDAFGTWQSVE